MADHNDVILGNDGISCNLGCMCQPKYIKIYKGYDTYFNGKHLIHFGIQGIYTEQNRKYKFVIGGITKTYENVTDGFFVDLTAAETGTLNLGPLNGTIIAIDESGHETLLTTAVPFVVENWVQGDVYVDQVNITINVKDGDTNEFTINLLSPYFETILHNDLQQRDADNCHPIKSITGLQAALNSKQDVIEDLSTIRAGAALGATALQPSALNNTTLTGNTTAEALKIDGYNALTTNSELDGTKLNEKTVSKDALTQAVQDSLDKADSAVQTITTGTENGTISVDGTDVAVMGLDSAAFTPASDYATAAQGSLADSAVQTIETGTTNGTISVDGTEVAVAGLESAAFTPSTDYATAAQGAKADTAVQTITTGSSNGSINVDGTDVDVKGLGTAAYTPSSDYATAAQGQKADSALQAEDVINNVASTSVTKPLSANMGKSLQDQIDNLKQRGHFLSLWNCATGLAQSNPPQSPYVYQAGDFFIIGTVAAGGSTNYKPNGSSYTTGVASTTVETEAVDENDVYWYDGTNWLLQINTQKEVTFGSVAGDPYDNTNLAGALNAKQDELTEGTGIDITNNTISNSGVLSVSTGSTDGTISVNTGGTPEEVAVAGLGSAAFKAAASFATSAQGTKADTAIQDVRTGTTNGTLAVDGADVAVKGLGSAAYTPSTDYATAAQGSKADTAVQPADISNMQTTTNLVTSVSSSSTDTQYPSAKLFFDTCGDIETLINAL